ncbi:hypothetical protein [Neptunicella marina]|uniref:Phytase-like domain-containing protein n=1 Tax=Neptunicella marina TaxID=2125989 RepID=A0A8J6IX21_9ALTE|nr:hypothetical protein [Neptunicella marina]MBC3767051.1 hypothetical protein [Neptunicella marina]
MKLIKQVGLLLALISASVIADDIIDVQGRWIKDPQGKIMADPQPSGLTHWRGHLVTLADRSAMLSQQGVLHLIDQNSARLLPGAMRFTLAESLNQSCFADYLADTPDLEALTVDPDNDKVFYTITEDASMSPLQGACKTQWNNTGSTEFPTLLVRLALNDQGELKMTHVRPLQFAAEMQVGNFPNDGIEGITFAKGRQMYIALEKDASSQARIFKLDMSSADFWKSEDFIKVQDPKLKLPGIDDGNHPINALDFYPGDSAEHPGYLLAMARNNNQLWIVDLAGEKSAKIIKLAFWAEVENPPSSCKDWEKMNNASIEGISLEDNILWMVNDPWKVNYLKNIQCEVNRPFYEQMAPLLFALPVDKSWFK